MCVDFKLKMMKEKEIVIQDVGAVDMIFFVRENRLYYKCNSLNEVFAWLIREAELIMPVYQVEKLDVDFYKDVEEVFVLEEGGGIFSVRKISGTVLGNSRFYAKIFRKLLKKHVFC